MDFINRVIVSLIEAGHHQTAYDVCGYVAAVAVLLFSVWYAHRMRASWMKTALITVVHCLLMAVVMTVVLWACSGFTEFGRANLAVSFVYMPPLAWVIGKVFRLPWARVSNQMALVMMLYHGFGRIGCIFTGCCYGYPFEAGIYSYRLATNVFPVQLVESAIAFSIFIILVCRAKKRAYVADENAMPLTLAIYGLGRFFTEFLHKNEKLLWGCSDLAFHALFMCLVGVAMLLIFRAKKNKRAQECASDN